MVTYKKVKIEMVCASGVLPVVLQILKNEAVHAYTVLDVRLGAGQGGVYEGGQLTGYTNQYLFFICEPEEETRMLEALRPLYNTYGGLLLSYPIDFHVRIT